MSERVKQLIEQAPLLGIPWSQSLCTRSGLRVCLLDEDTVASRGAGAGPCMVVPRRSMATSRSVIPAMS